MASMNRRTFIASISGALAWPSLARAQSTARVYRIGFLATYPQPAGAPPSPLVAAFLQGLRDLGYVEGRNLTFDRRHYGGKPERLPEVAKELARSTPDVIVTSVNAHTRAAMQATRTIPIVMIVGTGVVEEGFVASLARPGGNITGLTWDVGLEIVGKRFEFLKETVPGLSRVAVLWDQGQDTPAVKQEIERATAAVRLTPIWIDFTEDLEQMFRIAVRERAQALFTAGGARLFNHRKKIVELATAHRLPDTHYTGEFVEAGGLMSYAPNLPDMYRRAATYVDKILRGARPADLPVEQPTKIDLLVNMKTARARGVNLAKSLLIRADRVIDR